MIKAVKITLMLCFCFLLACPLALADDKFSAILQRLEELQKDVKELEGLKQEVAVLKEELKHEREGHDDQIDFLQEQIEEVKPVIDIAEQLAKTDVGGYFEFHYNSNTDDKSSNTLDFHRFVLNIDHEISDWIMFRSELELEHALVQGGDSKSGELELEQALLEFSLHENFNVRAGILLTPIGLINQHHEPTTFNGVERPFVDKYIIPTTWFDAGVGIFGQVLPGLDYQLNIMSGLEAENFSAKDGLRSGRQKAYKSKSEDLALAGRLVYTNIPGLQLGTSFYWGNSAQDLDDVGDVRVSIAEADFKYTRGKFDFRGEYALVNIGDADKLNQALGTTSGKDAIAEQLNGWYLEGAYRFLHDIFPATSHDANIFVRYEEFDTQHDMPSGYKANSEYDRTAWTFGASYFPVENVVVKGDLQYVEQGDGENDTLFNLGLGWHF